ncbi:MAG: VOC family protein [Burkholderiales bacterium]
MPLVNIDVDDLEKGVKFYSGAFGLKVGRRVGSAWVEMLGPSAGLRAGLDAPIYLLAKAPGTSAASATSQRRDYRRHWTPVHLDFVVEKIDSALQQALSAGAILEGEIETHQWGHIAHMADPFGHGFCLIEFRGRGYDELIQTNDTPEDRYG